MKCPHDDATLTMSERGGIEIDYCPECRGVWLDRGELDKIIERSLTQAPPAPAPAEPAPGNYERERDERRQHHDQRYSQPSSQYGNQPYRKKKENWLGEIFG